MFVYKLKLFNIYLYNNKKTYIIGHGLRFEENILHVHKKNECLTPISTSESTLKLHFLLQFYAFFIHDKLLKSSNIKMEQITKQ